eukprot:m51a1_g5677 hypothetical protein (222) ;mRNA; f:964779-965524
MNTLEISEEERTRAAALRAAFLWRAAHTYAETHEEVAAPLLRALRAMHSPRVTLPRSAFARYCPRCLVPFTPGVNCTVRTRRKRDCDARAQRSMGYRKCKTAVAYHCLRCNKSTRFLPLQKPQFAAVVRPSAPAAPAAAQKAAAPGSRKPATATAAQQQQAQKPPAASTGQNKRKEMAKGKAKSLMHMLKAQKDAEEARQTRNAAAELGAVGKLAALLKPR